MKRICTMRLFAIFAILVTMSVAPSTAQDPGATLIVQKASLTTVFSGLALRFHEQVQCDPALDAIELQNVTIPAPTFQSALSFLASAYSLYVQHTSGMYVVLAPGSGHTMQLVHLFNADATVVAQNAGSAAAAQKVALVVEPRSNGLLLIGPPAGVGDLEKIVNALDLPAQPEETARLEVYYKDPTDAASELSHQYPQSHGALQITGDEQSGDVLVTGSAGAIADARRILAEIDRPIPNVYLSLRVVDVTPRNDQTNVGVVLGGLSYSAGGSGASGAQVTPNQLFTPFLNRSLAVNATINTLVEHNEARVLQNPTSQVESGATATLHVGDEIPIVVNNGGLIGGNTVLTKPTGIDMHVTPVVDAGGNMRLRVTLSYAQFAGLLNGQPIFHDRSTSTVVDVKPGETITFGGLSADEESRTDQKVPILGDIPLFGRLFHNVSTSRQKEEIFFQLTPTLVKE